MWVVLQSSPPITNPHPKKPTKKESAVSKLDDLTIGEAKTLTQMFGKQKAECSLNQMIGEKCIIRTYSAGVWFGEIEQKEKDEVIVKNARRLWYWKAKKSISLSAVAQFGLSDESKVAPEVPKVWLQAIELIPVSSESLKSIEGAPDAKAQ